MRLKATLFLDSWAGRSETPVYIVGETSKRYRICADKDIKLPKRMLLVGKTALVPKYAIRIEEDKNVVNH